jgi:hypothetical protein
MPTRTRYRQNTDILFNDDTIVMTPETDIQNVTTVKKGFWKKFWKWIKKSIKIGRKSNSKKKSELTLMESDTTLDDGSDEDEYEDNAVVIKILPSHIYGFGEANRKKEVSRLVPTPDPAKRIYAPADVAYCLKWDRDISNFRGKHYAPFSYYTGELPPNKSIIEHETEALDYFIHYYSISVTENHCRSDAKPERFNMIMSKPLPSYLPYANNGYEDIMQRFSDLVKARQTKKSFIMD